MTTAGDTVITPVAEGVVMLTRVRLSYPNLYTARDYQGDGKFKYSAEFHLEAGSDNDKKIRTAIARVAATAWGRKAAVNLAEVNGQKQQYCYLDGAAKELDPGTWVLRAKRKVTDRPPRVIDQNMEPVTEANGLVYGGCYVNAKVELWAQDLPNLGMRCTLSAVQFVGHGDRFGGAAPANVDGFETVEESVDAGDLL